MRLLLTLLLCGLTPLARAEWTLEFRRTVADLPGGAQFIEREARREGRAVRVQGVFFSAKQARFAVIDNASVDSLGAAMSAAGALAGTNGAYFHPDNTPLGLMIAGGKKIHALERAKLLSGVFVVTKGRPRIVRAGKFTPSAADTEALQAGPFLVEGGAPISGLNATRVALRTVVATTGDGRWALLLVSSSTLADSAAVLSAAAVWPDFRIQQALNLDGGSSSGLWVATKDKPFYRREFSTVRNFLAVLPR
ncbi:MAG TPA: phosphodiester glycosidase family protein [Chthoniobacterales bacterium]|jgi:uncharacterized protein YigE (DUF2233 family)